MNMKVVTIFTAKKCRDVKNGFYAGTIHHRVVQSDNGLVFRSVRLNARLVRSMKRVHVLILTHTRGFKVFLTTHFKCSVVFGWNTRLMRSMKRLNTDAYARLKGILNDTLQVF